MLVKDALMVKILVKIKYYVIYSQNEFICQLSLSVTLETFKLV